MVMVMVLNSAYTGPLPRRRIVDCLLDHTDEHGTAHMYPHVYV